MQLGTRYVVTKASDDGTFEVGDHVYLNNDGSISCVEAEGWIEAEYVKESIIGMEYKIDEEWIEKRKEKLLAELESLDSMG